MPNGRSRSQRSRTANARRNRARDRARVRGPEAAMPAFHRILLECEAAEPDLDAESYFFKAFRRFICEGHTRGVAEVMYLKGAIQDAGGERVADFVERVAEALPHENHWGCSAAIIEAAVQNLRAAGFPEPIVDALHKTQMPVAKPAAKTAAKPAAKTATKTAWAPSRAPDPEPAPGDCMTCCHVFARENLVGCKTPNCTYVQCVACMIKGGGGACTRPGCNHVHMKCPQCREMQWVSAANGRPLQLGDLEPHLLVLTLDSVRKRCRKHDENAVEHLATVMDNLN
eukprot:COSAG02_NODE_5500_length_4278_cov_2.452501_5_plen_284_part_01